jgi:hypothetical protein
MPRRFDGKQRLDEPIVILDDAGVRHRPARASAHGTTSA